MQKQLPMLTALRGIAALIVVLFHARLILFPQWNPLIESHTLFIKNGYLWVDLFFILSGFIMMHCYRIRFENHVTASNWRHYMWQRFSRIYPLFIATFLILFFWESYKLQAQVGFYGGPLLESWGLTGISAFEGPFNQGRAILANLLLLQGISSRGLTWNIAGWSLSIEWLCYFAFPFCAYWLQKQKLASIFLIPTILLGVYGLLSSHNTLDITSGMEALFRGACGFLFGASLYGLVQFKQTTWLSSPIIPVISLCGCFWLLHEPLTPSTSLICFVFFGGLVASSAQQTTHPFNRILDNRFTRWLGDISYSLYLWHSVFLLVGVEWLNLIAPQVLVAWYTNDNLTLAAFVVSGFVLATCLFSWLSYRLLEIPAQTWMRDRLVKQRDTLAVSKP